MSEQRLQRTREAYEAVADMAPYGCKIRLGYPDVDKVRPWRAPHENAAEQLARAAFLTGRDCGDERTT